MDERDRVHLGGYPAPLREVLGVRVEEFCPAAEHERFPVRGHGVLSHLEGVADLWREDLRLAGAAPELVFDSAGWAGRPAVTRHEFGKGIARYLSTRLDAVTMRAVLGRALAEAGVAPVVEGLPAGIQAGVRAGAGRRFLILLNHTGDKHDIALSGEWERRPGPVGRGRRHRHPAAFGRRRAPRRRANRLNPPSRTPPALIQHGAGRAPLPPGLPIPTSQGRSGRPDRVRRVPRARPDASRPQATTRDSALNSRPATISETKPSGPTRAVTDQRDPVQGPLDVEVIEIRWGQVGRGPVVPEGDAARLPGASDGVLGTGDLLVEQFQDAPALRR